MSAGFTKGPWRVDGFNEVLAGDPCLELMVIGQGDYIVAQMVPERDAALIAAAPALLEALTPFATCWTEEELDGATDDMPIEHALYAGSQPTVGDLRRALAALNQALGGPTHDRP